MNLFNRSKSSANTSSKKRKVQDKNPVPPGYPHQVRGSIDDQFSLPKGVKFTFVLGASGSGTTMLTRLMGNTTGSVALGGNYTSINDDETDARMYPRYMNHATEHLWDRKGSLQSFLDARKQFEHVLHEFVKLPKYQDAHHLVYKRSAPFLFGDRHRPDLLSLVEMFPETRVVVMLRDPRASTFSSFRREFGDTFKQLAVICEEQLTYINAQLNVLPSDQWMIINYESFCKEPVKYIKEVAAFTKLDEAELVQAVEAEGISALENKKWQERLTDDEVTFLNRFFGSQRIQQFDKLAKHLNL